MATGYSFTDALLPEVSDAALELADAIHRVEVARVELDAAMARVPGYTGQYDPTDYYRDEQAEFNEAAQALHNLIWGKN